MERHLLNIILKHLELNNIINEHQYGYQKGKSTDALLSEVGNFIHEKLELNLNVILCFIDFSKAFDTLNFEIIINELKEIGLDENMLLWFQNYLTNRSCVVKISKILSENKPLNQGFT